MKGGSRIISKKFNGLNLWNQIYKKKEFLILVFANLIAQLGITYYVMNKTDNPELGFWPLFIAQIIIIWVLALVPMPPILKFLIFSVFSYTFGLTLTHLKDKYDPTLIDVAIKGALTIFVFMMTVGITLAGFNMYLGYQFGAFLFWALLVLIIAKLVNMLGPKLSIVKKGLAYIGLGLFSLFVVYDTNQILSRDYKGDFITASMDYYLDILNLFSNFLSSDD
jgi:FtsH-binding integral membrane protein